LDTEQKEEKDGEKRKTAFDVVGTKVFLPPTNGKFVN